LFITDINSSFRSGVLRRWRRMLTATLPPSGRHRHLPPCSSVTCTQLAAFHFASSWTGLQPTS